MDKPLDAYALIVGIAAYEDIPGLPDAVTRDARDLHALLIDPQTCAYPESNVELLLNERATRSRIMEALEHLSAHSQAASTVLIYISSHGGRISTGPGAGEYLLPTNVKLGTGWHGIGLDPATAISDAQLTAALAAIRAQKLVVIFDCCHSGGIGHVKDSGELILKSGFSDEYLQSLAAGRGRVILASSRNTEKSWILPGGEHSLFTEHLLAGLRGGCTGHDGLIRIFDLFEYLQPRVTAAQPMQHPVFKGEVEENFAVAFGSAEPKDAHLPTQHDYLYDVYISWTGAPEDTRWLKEKVLPALNDANLRVAMTGQVDEPGVAWVVTVERAVTQAKRTLLLLSCAYLENQWADFENTLAQQLSIEQRRARLLPVVIDAALLDHSRHLSVSVPLRLRQLASLDLTDEFFGVNNLAKLPTLLQQPISLLR